MTISTETLAIIDSVNKKIVLKETWGHLYPKPGKIYKGSILYTNSEYGDLTIIKASWKGLSDSPRLFEAMQDFIWNWRGDPGCVYFWEGTCQFSSSENGDGDCWEGKPVMVIVEKWNKRIL